MVRWGLVGLGTVRCGVDFGTVWYGQVRCGKVGFGPVRCGLRSGMVRQG